MFDPTKPRGRSRSHKNRKNKSSNTRETTSSTDSETDYQNKSVTFIEKGEDSEGLPVPSISGPKQIPQGRSASRTSTTQQGQGKEKETEPNQIELRSRQR